MMTDDEQLRYNCLVEANKVGLATARLVVSAAAEFEAFIKGDSEKTD